MITIYRGLTMNIIFGKEQADALQDKYTVLELDCFQFGHDGPILSAYCTVERMPLDELITLETTKAQHDHLIINYRGRAWPDCLTGIEQLRGKWSGELDSFYDELESRVTQYLKNDPGADWSPAILKPTT
jgi:hypothetical protein